MTWIWTEDQPLPPTPSPPCIHGTLWTHRAGGMSLGDSLVDRPLSPEPGPSMAPEEKRCMPATWGSSGKVGGLPGGAKPWKGGPRGVRVKCLASSFCLAPPQGLHWSEFRGTKGREEEARPGGTGGPRTALGELPTQKGRRTWTKHRASLWCRGGVEGGAGLAGEVLQGLPEAMSRVGVHLPGREHG